MTTRIDHQVDAIRDRLTHAREQAGLSQAQAAHLLGFSAASNVSQYEGGRSTPNLHLFLRMCDVYGVSPSWALTGHNPDFDPMPLMEAFGELTADAFHLVKLLESVDQPPDAEAARPGFDQGECAP